MRWFWRSPWAPARSSPATCARRHVVLGFSRRCGAWRHPMVTWRCWFDGDFMEIFHGVLMVIWWVFFKDTLWLNYPTEKHGDFPWLFFYVSLPEGILGTFRSTLLLVASSSWLHMLVQHVKHVWYMLYTHVSMMCWVTFWTILVMLGCTGSC